MESINSLNQQLKDQYGTDTSTGKVIFRIVWANDETEKRMVQHTDSGIELLYPEVREVKKYPYLADLYVLERLVVIPDINKPELPAAKLSYEPIWAYCDGRRQPLPPIWGATKLIIDTLYAALGKKSLRTYIENPDSPEVREKRLDKIQEELFGNESNVTDALTHKQGVAGFHPMKDDI